MAPDSPAPDLAAAGSPPQPDWPWSVGLVVETPELLSGIALALRQRRAFKAFEFSPSVSSFEVAAAVDRQRPDILFVELSRTSKSAADWILDVRRGEQMPLVVAVHLAPEPAEMITALRAGASEFLCLPIQPALSEAMDRMGVLLEGRRDAAAERGTIVGILSAKGGCGATTVACYLASALSIAAAQPGASKTGAGAGAGPNAPPRPRILIADLDHQAPAARAVLQVNAQSHAGDALEAVRRLSSHSWREFVAPAGAGVELLASAAEFANATAPLPEAWRVEGLFRFILRQYGWIFVDLGRHLNPANWTLLQHIDELFIVTVPDVLALYQTRSILQTLAGRGFERGRTRIILNKNQSSPRDFWVESIEQMFEMGVFGVIPSDESTLGKLAAGNNFDRHADTLFGKALMKIAARILKNGGPGVSSKAA